MYIIILELLYILILTFIVEQEVSSPVIEQNACPLPLNKNTDVAAELIVGNVTLRLFNGADQQLVQSAMQYLGGVSRAW